MKYCYYRGRKEQRLVVKDTNFSHIKEGVIQQGGENALYDGTRLKNMPIGHGGKGLNT